MSWENLILEKEDGIGILKINRPKALNALNSAVMADLEDCLPKIAADPEIKVVIITGEGDRSFVAGADIGQMQPPSPEEGAKWGRQGQAVSTAL